MKLRRFMSSSLAFKTAYSREIAPVSHRLWVSQRENELERVQADVAQWLTDVAEYKKLFEEHVYSNKDVTDLDLRQHRARLYLLLSMGEGVALMFIEWAYHTGKPKEVEAHLNLLDQTLKELFKTLVQWHGDLQAQPDIPDSFKRAVQEVEHGNVVEFEPPHADR